MGIGLHVAQQYIAVDIGDNHVERLERRRPAGNTQQSRIAKPQVQLHTVRCCILQPVAIGPFVHVDAHHVLRTPQLRQDAQHRGAATHVQHPLPNHLQLGHITQHHIRRRVVRRAETHLRLNHQLVVHIGPVRMERRTNPDACAVVGLHQYRLVPFLPLRVPVAVLHLRHRVLQRQRKRLHRHLQEVAVELVDRHIGLHTLLRIHKTLIRPLGQLAHQHIAKHAGIVHRKTNFYIFHTLKT